MHHDKIAVKVHIRDARESRQLKLDNHCARFFLVKKTNTTGSEYLQDMLSEPLQSRDQTKEFD